MVDLRGRLDPESIPGTKVDTDTIADQATTLGSTGTAIGGAGADAALEWQSMATHYVAPEGDLLLGLMGPVETMTSSVSADTATAQTALATFADEAAPIVKKLVDLKVAAWNFLTKTEYGITIPGDSPYNIYEKAKPKGKFSPPPSADDKPESVHLDWDQYQPWVDENEERQADVTTQATQLAEKVATCVNILLPMVETVLGEEIPEYVPMDYVEFEASGGALPWGVDVPDAHTDGIHFTAGILESLAETISGLGTLVLGFNPETGGFFDGSVWGPSWVSTLALAGALVVQPLDDLLDGLQQGNVDDDWLDGADNGLSTVVGDEAWKTTWEGFVGTPEDWEHNPAQAAGSLTFNIGTVLIPTGAGAAAKATALGEKVSSVASKAAAAAADAGVPASLSVKLGQLLADGLLTVGGGFTKLDDALNAALKPFADALAKADTSVADFAAWVKSLPEFQGPDGQFAGIPNGGRIPEVPSGGKPGPWPSTATPDVRTPEMPAPDRTPGSQGGLIDDHGGVRDPSGRGPDLDGDGKPDARDPDWGQPKSGVPASDGGITDPSSVDPYKATLGVNDTVPELSDAFDNIFDDRTEAAAARVEAVAAQNAKLAELAEHGIDVSKGELTKGTIEKTIAAQIGDVNADPTLAPEVKAHLAQKLLELEKLSWAERDGLTAQLKLSEAMGDQAAKDVIASQDASLLYESKKGKDSFDQVGLSADGSTLVITEAKGGASSLSKAGRVLPDGTRAPQGSTMYFNDVFRVDKQLQQHLAENPALAEGLADGSIKVSYQLVKAKESGSVTVQEIVLNPNALDLGLGK